MPFVTIQLILTATCRLDIDQIFAAVLHSEEDSRQPFLQFLDRTTQAVSAKRSKVMALYQQGIQEPISGSDDAFSWLAWPIFVKGYSILSALFSPPMLVRMFHCPGRARSEKNWKKADFPGGQRMRFSKIGQSPARSA